jgi:RNA binding exosome subunit
VYGRSESDIGISGGDGNSMSPIQSVEVTYFVHATEDQDKILGAVEKMFGVSSPEIERLEGHFGNEILKARVHVTGESASKVFRTIVSGMNPNLIKEIGDNLAMYLDEHSSMFLRLDKQALVSGSVVLGSGDPVRIKVKPRTYMAKGGAPSFFRELMEGA